MILFLGSIIGGIVQCGQIFLSAAQLYSDSVPDWLVYRSGSVLMVFTTIFIFPPCMVELMTQVCPPSLSVAIYNLPFDLLLAGLCSIFRMYLSLLVW